VIIWSLQVAVAVVHALAAVAELVDLRQRQVLAFQVHLR
jgi:hypothetical protein